VIDWFTVIAQIINFVILVALLKYFLYGRILTAMRQRQERLTALWEEAHQQRDAAAQELSSAREKNHQLDEQRETLLARVRDEVEQYRKQLTADMRSDVDDMQRRWIDAMQEEHDAFLRDLHRRGAEKVCQIACHALSDLADADLERQMVRRFAREVEQLGQAEREAVISSLKSRKRTAVVQTTRPLPDDLQAVIASVLRERLLPEVRVKFEQSDDLVCGIAVQTDSHTLAWDLRDYFASLEQELRNSLDEETAARRPRPRETVDVGD
jgi:F-type H+-transporting ATPase subunit b